MIQETKEVENKEQNYNALAEVPITEIDNDRLGLSRYAESLADYIMNCETPTTVAVQGEWGSGKTSLVNMVFKKLETVNKEKYISIKFSAWQYSQFSLEDSLQITFLNRFLEGLIEASGKKEDIIGALELVKKVTAGFAKRAAIYTASRIGGDELKDAAAEAIETVVSGTEEDQINALKNKIEETIKKLCGDNNEKKIVVFIDDLDRLSSTKAVEILEVIKIFLDCKNCVFLLAIDTNIINQGVMSRYGLSEEKAQYFYEKLVQTSFFLPISQYDFSSYVNSIWPKEQEEAQNKNYVKKLCYDSECFMEQCNHVLHKDIVELLQMASDKNPRAAKRIINAFQIQNMGMWVNASEEETSKEVIIEKLKEEKTSQKVIPEISKILFALVCIQNKLEPDYEFIMEMLGNSVFFKQWLNSNTTIEFDDDELRKKLAYTEEKIVRYKKDKSVCGNMIAIFKDWCREFLNNQEEQKEDKILSLCSFLSATNARKWKAQDVNSGLLAKVILNEYEKRLGKIRREIVSEYLENNKDNADIINWYEEAKEVLVASKSEVQYLSHKNMLDKITELSKGIYRRAKVGENIPDIMELYDSIDSIKFRYAYPKMIREQFVEGIVEDLNRQYIKKANCEEKIKKIFPYLDKLDAIEKNNYWKHYNRRKVYSYLDAIVYRRFKTFIELLPENKRVYDVIMEHIEYEMTSSRIVKDGGRISMSLDSFSSLFSTAVMLEGTSKKTFLQMENTLKQNSNKLGCEELKSIEEGLYKKNIWEVDFKQRKELYDDIRSLFKHFMDADANFTLYFGWIQKEIDCNDLGDNASYEQRRLRWYFGLVSALAYCEGNEVYIRYVEEVKKLKEKNNAWKNIFKAVSIIKEEYLDKDETADKIERDMFWKIGSKAVEELQYAIQKENGWIYEDLGKEYEELTLGMVRESINTFNESVENSTSNAKDSYELGRVIARHFDETAWGILSHHSVRPYVNLCCFEKREDTYLWKFYEVYSKIIHQLRLQNEEWLEFQHKWGNQNIQVYLNEADDDYGYIDGILQDMYYSRIFSAENLQDDMFYQDISKLGWDVNKKITVGKLLYRFIHSMDHTFFDYFRCIGRLIYLEIPQYLNFLEDGSLTTDDLILESAKKRHEIFWEKYDKGFRFLREIAEESM